MYEPGVISAMNEDISVIDCDITVLTDDDTAAYPDWLRLIEDHFNSDETIGAVGGRDHQKIHPGSQKKLVSFNIQDGLLATIISVLALRDRLIS